MKKIVASASILTLGLLCGQSAQAQQDSKPWSLTGTLRGFYDDNYATLPSKAATPTSSTRRSSLGFEVSPSAAVNFSWDTTGLDAKYTYGMKYYEDRKNNSADHSHQFDLGFKHSFSERYRFSASDSFVIAQEPALIDPGVITNPLRSDGNNIVNRFNTELNATLTDQLGFDVSYANSYFDYQQDGDTSRSANLDRIEHLITLNGRWNVLENSTALLGYSFGMTDQKSKDSLTQTAPPASLPYLSPSIRDSRSHFIFLGLDEKFTPELTMQARAGMQYIQYPHAPAGTSKDTLSPYIDIQGSYQYSQDGQVTLGVKHQHNQTDVASTLDAETTTFYTSLNQKITPLLTASLTAQYQNSSFNGGTVNKLEDNFFTAGLNLSYEINKWLTAETGYNYDRLDSDLTGRSFYRNRVFIGIRASY